MMKLTRLRIRLWWNSFKHSSLPKKFLYAGLGLGMIVFAGFLLFISWGLLYLLRNPEVNRVMQESGIGLDLDQILVRLPVLVLGGVFLAGILTTFGALLQTLYLSGDMEFLLAAPIPAHSVFASKLLLAVFPGLVILGLLTIPALIGLGLSQGYNLLYFFLVPLTLIMLVFSAAGLSSILVMAVVRLMPARRAAEILGVLGGLVALTFSQLGQFTDRIDDPSLRFMGAISTLDRAATPLNPLSWPGLGLSALGQGDWGPALLFVGLTLLSTTSLVAISLFLAERMYFNGWSRVQAGTIAKKRPAASKESTGRQRLGLRDILPAPVAAMIAKDFRMYRRDLRNLSQLVTPILFAIVWTFALNRPDRDFSIPNPEGIPGQPSSFFEIGSVGIALFIGWMFAIRFGMGGISSEGKQWWIIKSSPLRTGHLLLAKFLVALVPTLALSLAYFGVSSIYRGTDPVTILFHSLVIVVVTAAECSLLLAFGVWTANFSWDNPRQLNSGVGGCLGTLATSGFIMVATILFIGLPSLANLVGIPPSLGLIAGVTSGIALCVAAGAGPIWATMSRVPKLGEL
jgi:ABC-2 type transport system permease protein